MTEQEKYDLIKRALTERKCVTAIYKEKTRELCPHVLGKTAAGKMQGLFYQYAGESSKGLKDDGRDWRCIPIDGLAEVSMCEGEWRGVRGPKAQTCVTEVDVEVPLPA